MLFQSIMFQLIVLNECAPAMCIRPQSATRILHYAAKKRAIFIGHEVHVFGVSTVRLVCEKWPENAKHLSTSPTRKGEIIN